jgi:hypothetical protein
VSDVRAKYVPPSVKETAFNCPHCGALAKQHWFSICADPLKKDQVPTRMDRDKIRGHDFSEIPNEEKRNHYLAWAAKLACGQPAFLWENKDAKAVLSNVEMSRCFNCDDIALWVFDRIVWPRQGAAALPNPDMPADIRRDYDEASTILELSPRGAAALLRLAVQKLCKHLGQQGKNINFDIAALVAKGLDPRVQQALDVVRVVGNDAVHPGAIDLRDDRATAERLFGLVNLIVERMISYPKHVDALYATLPETNRAEIAKRDAKAAGSPE